MSDTGPEIEAEVMVHGVAVAVGVDPDGPLAGVLLIGNAGKGKSQAALSLISECQWRRSRLVADDCVILRAHRMQLQASSPEPLAGLIEMRGFGPVRVPVQKNIPIKLVLDFDKPTERIPSLSSFEPVDGGPWAPLLPFDPNTQSSVSARIGLILRAFLAGQIP